ncbi:GlxA family transcriptional regulator [Streptomonospora wellingtoniae]|uniref:Helix-turn-helix domain-containing protein n=1 Tax=Streptomonospora wellingtoniae TaxID=3075544 RepID=A0ABU2KW38_9ACTN|nr:helix-turn-helix domain-containing protein [Streptomonospora sp. DSM 45055]MDT0303465.1 helix-turn-helix domain-containing protein [Streptomonospora sp. DSM 45055]
MSAFLHPDRHRIAVLVRQGVLAMELSIVHQLFSQAAVPGGERLYEVVTCAVTAGGVRTTADFALSVAHGPEALAEADTVIVPASDEDYGPGADARLPAPLAAALARIPAHARIASICTGAFVLAGAGLLDGRKATTHWNSAARFRRLYPTVDMDPNVFYVDEGTVLTAAGEASGIDLCLHMIRKDHGIAVANDVARSAVVPAHREGGQAQFIRRTAPEPQRSTTGRARAWALDHLDRALTLRDLAARETMSVRTFTRRFRSEMGISPLEWLTQQRIERARRLLEETDLPVDRVAEDSGFGTTASLRQHLRAQLGMSPSAYRNTFHPSYDRAGR